MSRRTHTGGEIRRHIAAEAARLLARQEARGPQDACRKAAARLGCRDRAKWPDSREIEQSLSEYQQLFQADWQADDLERLRRRALEAMQRLRTFRPRLVGPVLRGTAGHDQPVRLHLYADSPEQLILHLMEQRIPYTERSIQLRYSDHSTRTQVLLEITAGGVDMELVPLSPAARSNPPLDPWSQRPEQGAGIGQLTAMLEEPAA